MWGGYHEWEHSRQRGDSFLLIEGSPACEGDTTSEDTRGSGGKFVLIFKVYCLCFLSFVCCLYIPLHSRRFLLPPLYELWRFEMTVLIVHCSFSIGFLLHAALICTIATLLSIFHLTTPVAQRTVICDSPNILKSRIYNCSKILKVVSHKAARRRSHGDHP